MTLPNKMMHHRVPWQPSARSARGFSLLELMVAIVVFTVVSGAAFSLAVQHEQLAQRELQVSALNTSLRSATGQLQEDLANAGTGYFATGNNATFPIGVIVDNSSPAAACNSGAPTFTYSSNCFDTLSIIEADTTTLAGFQPLALHPALSTATTGSGTLLATPEPLDTAAKDAAYFNVGDELLIYTATATGSTNDCYCQENPLSVQCGGGNAYKTPKFTAVVLTQAGGVSGGNIQFTYAALPTNGQVPKNTANADPLELTAFCSLELASNSYPFQQVDWIIRLDGIKYYVDTTDPTDPKLMRWQRGVASQVTDQIIGFKVGAALWDKLNSGTTDLPDYQYDSSNYSVDNSPPNGDDAYDFSLVRSLRLCLIGRTKPGAITTAYQNPFDGGPYAIEAISTGVNPRNLNLNSQ